MPRQGDAIVLGGTMESVWRVVVGTEHSAIFGRAVASLGTNCNAHYTPKRPIPPRKGKQMLNTRTPFTQLPVANPLLAAQGPLIIGGRYTTKQLGMFILSHLIRGFLPPPPIS